MQNDVLENLKSAQNTMVNQMTRAKTFLICCVPEERPEPDTVPLTADSVQSEAAADKNERILNSRSIYE